MTDSNIKFLSLSRTIPKVYSILYTLSLRGSKYAKGRGARLPPPLSPLNPTPPGQQPAAGRRRKKEKRKKEKGKNKKNE